MKIALALLCILLVSSFGQRAYGDGRPVRSAGPVRSSRPPPSQSRQSVGMTYQSPPPETEQEQMLKGVVLMMLQQFEHTHIDRYDTEEGDVFTNIDIFVTAPTDLNDIKLKFDEAGNSDISLHNVGILIDADMDMYYGTGKGHFTIEIKKLGIDLKTVPIASKPFDTMHIEFQFHLTDADFKVNADFIEDTSNLPPELQDKIQQTMGGLNMNFKVAANDMLDNTFEQKTKEVINNYLDSMSSQYRIPRKLDHNQMGDIIINAKALPFSMSQKGAVIIDFDTHADMVKSPKQSVKDLLMHPQSKSGSIVAGENALETTRAELNDNKHHLLIAPHLVSGVLTNFDNSALSFKLGDQPKLQKQVSEYFGGDVELECYKHENELPEYHVDGNAIVGEQTVKCALHPKGYKFDSLYEIDIKLNFQIHPEVDEDGKSLKAQFGDIQTTGITVHDKKMEIETTVYDKMDKGPMIAMNPFMQEIDFPAMFNPELFNSKIGGRDTQNLAKFGNILRTPNMIDISKLEKTLLPESFRMPIPTGMRFSPDTTVKIHQNGVLDISGDLLKE